MIYNSGQGESVSSLLVLKYIRITSTHWLWVYFILSADWQIGRFTQFNFKYDLGLLRLLYYTKTMSNKWAVIRFHVIKWKSQLSTSKLHSESQVYSFLYLNHKHDVLLIKVEIIPIGNLSTCLAIAKSEPSKLCSTQSGLEFLEPSIFIYVIICDFA